MTNDELETSGKPIPTDVIARANSFAIKLIIQTLDGLHPGSRLSKTMRDGIDRMAASEGWKAEDDYLRALRELLSPLDRPR